MLLSKCFLHFRGVGCGVYTTNSAEATLYCLENGMCNIAVVEDDNQVQKILKYKDKLPELKALIQYSGKPTAQGVLSVRVSMVAYPPHRRIFIVA